MRRVIGAVVVLGLLAGCGATSPAPSGGPSEQASPTVEAGTMNGTMLLGYGDVMAGGVNYTGGNAYAGNCQGENGYDDIHAGTEVTVSDASDKVVGLGSLVGGIVTKRNDVNVCGWTFTVTGLPKSAFYKVEVSHRGQVTFPAAQLGDVEVQIGVAP